MVRKLLLSVATLALLCGDAGAQGTTSFGGIGAVFTADNGVPVLSQLMPGGPAAQAGLQPGDVVTAVDGRDVTGIAPDDLIGRVRGAPGTVVTLVVRHADGSQNQYRIQRASFTATPPAAGIASPQPSPAGWSAWSNGSGLSLNLPSGWRAGPAAQDGWAQVQGPHGETVVIGPILAKGSLNQQGAAAVLAGLARNAGGARSWSMPRPIGPQALQMVGSGGSDLSIASLHWAPSQAGTAAMFTTVTADESSLKTESDLLRTLLNSISLRSLGEAAGGGGEARLNFTGWRDPLEGSFTVEVPVGWQVQGGAMRYSSVDIRPGVMVVSTDGQAAAILGDTQLVRQMRQVPSQLTTMMGIREGQTVPNSYGPPIPLQRYQPGAAAAAGYAQSRIPQLTGGRCGHVTLDSGRDTPDLAQRTNALTAGFRQQGIAMHADAGAVDFHCDNGWTGTVMVQTQLIQVLSSGLNTWFIDELSAFVASPAQASAARAAQARLLASYRLDPSWEARQQQTTMQTSHIVSQTQNQISQMIHDSFQNQVQAHDRAAQNDAEARRGTITVRDPDGSEHTVWNTSNYYWMTRDGTRVGTDGPSPPPDIDISQALDIVHH